MDVESCSRIKTFGVPSENNIYSLQNMLIGVKKQFAGSD